LRKVQRLKTFAEIPDFQGKPTESRGVAHNVGFPTLPGLPPASPIYIPQTGGFEIT
jgi:hypothetical protein